MDFLEVTVAEKSGVSLKRFFSRLLVPTPETITYILRYIINAYKIRVQYKSSYILIYIMVELQRCMKSSMGSRNGW